MPNVVEPRFCGGINWDDPRWFDPWRCANVMTEYNQDDVNRDGITHMCAASQDHESDHCCTEGHRWPQHKPRGHWRDRIRMRRRRTP